MGVVERTLKGTHRRDRAREAARRAAARQHIRRRRHSDGTNGLASTPQTELNAVRWQVKSLGSSRSVAPLGPKQELLYELLCLRERELVEISAKHRRGPAGDAVCSSALTKPTSDVT
jgi:hypothetical protein